MSKDRIGFPKEIFGSPKGLSQICIRVDHMMYVDQLDVFRCPIAPSWLPKEVKHLGSALVFLVEILSRPSNNLKKSFLENTVHIA